MSRCAHRVLQALLVCVAALGTLLGPVEVHAQRVAELEAEYQRAVETAQSGDVAQAAVQFTALLERLPDDHSLATLSIYGAARSYEKRETAADACTAVDLFTRFLGRKDAEVEKRERASKALPKLIERCSQRTRDVTPAPENRTNAKRKPPKTAENVASFSVSPPKPARNGLVFLTIVSNEPTATLMRLGKSRDGESRFQTRKTTSPIKVCSPPCEQWLDRKDKFAIANISSDSPLSESIILPDKEQATLHIDSKSKSSKAFGRGLAFVGVAMAFVGVGVLASTDGDSGGALTILGASAGGLGIALDKANTAEMRFAP